MAKIAIALAGSTQYSKTYFSTMKPFLKWTTPNLETAKVANT